MAAGHEEPSRPLAVGEMTTNSPEAYRQYVAGILEIENESFKNADREFEQAVELDSTFALAYFQLSWVYSGWGRGAPEHGLAYNYGAKAWEFRSHLGIKDRMRLEAWMQQLDSRKKNAIATYKEMIARWPGDGRML